MHINKPGNIRFGLSGPEIRKCLNIVNSTLNDYGDLKKEFKKEDISWTKEMLAQGDLIHDVLIFTYDNKRVDKATKKRFINDVTYKFSKTNDLNEFELHDDDGIFIRCTKKADDAYFRQIDKTYGK